MSIKHQLDDANYTKDIRLFAVARHQVLEGLTGLGMLDRFASDLNDQKLANKIAEARELLSAICEAID